MKFHKLDEKEPLYKQCVELCIDFDSPLNEYITIAKAIYMGEGAFRIQQEDAIITWKEDNSE